jgi:hypothetical protein
MKQIAFLALGLLTAAGAIAAGPQQSAAGDRAPVLTADQARALLSMSGANVGTIRRLDGVGRVRIDGLTVSAEGRWIVIRVLPSILEK